MATRTLPAARREPKCCIRGPIHYWQSGSREWKKSEVPKLPGPAARFHETCIPSIGGDDTPDVQIILARAEDVKEHSSCYQHFLSELQMPSLWFTEYSRKSNGYFGSEILTDDDCHITGIATWCRFLTKTFTPPKNDPEDLKYHWDKLNMYTHWSSASNKTTIVLFIRPNIDYKDSAFNPKTFFNGLTKKYIEDPFWMYAFALGDIAEKQNDSVWKVRSAVRAKEKKAESKNKEEDKMDYRSLHDLARHTIHGTEMLDAAVAVTELILREHEPLKDLIAPGGLANQEGIARHMRFRASSHITRSSLTYHLSLFRTLLYRSTSNKERLLNEINLVFNTVAQDDAARSHEIAKVSRLDAASMKTIAFVTTAFLPATFIAAIFSTSFFNFEQGKGWDVSGQFWIYWVFAVPVTAVAIWALHAWQKWFVEEGQQEAIAKVSTWKMDDTIKMLKRSNEATASSTNGALSSVDVEMGRWKDGVGR